VGLDQQRAEAGNEALPVGIISKDRAPLDATRNHVLQHTGNVETGLAGHGAKG
jgi:hypothetical protein